MIEVSPETLIDKKELKIESLIILEFKKVKKGRKPSIQIKDRLRGKGKIRSNDTAISMDEGWGWGCIFKEQQCFETTEEQKTNERFRGFVVVLNHI